MSEQLKHLTCGQEVAGLNPCPGSNLLFYLPSFRVVGSAFCLLAEIQESKNLKKEGEGVGTCVLQASTC